jgi:FkbM family methyltransferase
MVLNFDQLYYKYNLNLKGVIHIGAHFGSEYNVYKKYGIPNCLFFEPLPHTFEVLKNNIGKNNNVILVNKALGNDNTKIMMNVERVNNGQSSSILEPKLHLKQYPDIVFNEKIEVDMIKLDDYMINNNLEYNFINIDVQGYELEVFKGSKNTLNNIDYVMAEVNKDEVYKDCARVEQLDDFLKNYNFKRVETNWIGGTWGDAFYIKK